MLGVIRVRNVIALSQGVMAAQRRRIGLRKRGWRRELTNPGPFASSSLSVSIN
jgi:hypothetical protein